MNTAPARTTGWVLTVVLASAAQLVVGWFYLVSGLVVPIPAYLVLLLWWAVLTALLIRAAVQRSWWVAAAPVVAAASLVIVVSVGGWLLGWTA